MKNFRKTFSISSVAFILVGLALLLWPEQVLHLLLRIAAVLAITAGICLLVPLRR